jgi:hypothetical protein
MRKALALTRRETERRLLQERIRQLRLRDWTEGEGFVWLVITQMTPDKSGVIKNVVQLSVNSSIRGGGNNVKSLGEIISAFSPRYRSSPQMGEWTRRDSNPLVSRFARDFGCRLPLRSRPQSASTLTESCATVCTTGPVGSFASRGDRCKDANHNSFGRFQIGRLDSAPKMTRTSCLPPSLFVRN